jgi:hypothetical protein
MRMKRVLSGFLTAVVSAGCAFGQVSSPELETLKRSAFDHFYNLEYEASLMEFRAVAVAEPGNPGAWNHIATALFYESLFDAGLMGSDLIKTNDAMTKAPKLAISPQRDQEMQQATGKSIALCEAALQKNPKDITALYELGNALAFRANFTFLVRHAWIDGLKDANQSRKLHEQILKLEPGNFDARLVPGTHEYMIGTLPLVVRLLARTAGVSGNREKGLRMVEEAAAQGRESRMDAQILLPALYRRENRSKDGIPSLHQLADQYPRNFLFRVELAKFYADAGQTADAVAELRHIRELKDRKAPGYYGEHLPFIQREEAELQRMLGNAGANEVATPGYIAAVAH